MYRQFSKYHAAPEGGEGASGEKETFELLNVEEPEETLELEPKKPAKEDEEEEPETPEEDEEEKEEDDELKEIEEELEGPKDEDLELTTPVRRREILAKYPKLFKDFPYLEKAYYREQQFTELMPTIQDAKTAVAKAQFLDKFDRDLMNGDISTVLHAAKEADHEAFLRIADNYLPTLRKVDQQAYYHVMGNVIKDTIVTMVREGRALGEQGAPLQAAANVLNQFIFGSQQFTPPTMLSRQSNPDEQQRAYVQATEERNRVVTQFESTKDELQTKADNVLKATISQNIDPRKSMTDFVRTHAEQEALNTLENLMAKDVRFRGLLDRLWEKAFEQRFNKDSTDKIKSAYLSKAKTLLPAVIKKARNDALKGMGRRVSEQVEEEETQEPAKRGPITSGRSTPPSSGKFRKPSDIPKGMSTLDVLMKD
jgi:hypothetical protein